MAEVVGFCVHLINRQLDAVDDAVEVRARYACVDADHAGVGCLSLPEHGVEEQESADGEYRGQGYRDYNFECIERKGAWTHSSYRVGRPCCYHNYRLLADCRMQHLLIGIT